MLPAKAGGFAGSWTSSLYLSLSPSFDLDVKSVATLIGEFHGIDYRQALVFTQNGIETYTASADWAVWVLDLGARVGFLASEPRMDYLLLGVETMLTGIYFSGTLLLEYESINKAYGLGVEFVAEGKINEVTLTLTSRFGLEENVAEELGWQFGSGYDVVPRLRLASLCFTEATLEVDGVKLCGSKLGITATLSKQSGFEYAMFQWTYPIDCCPIDLEFRLRFQIQTKSLTLRPRFRAEGIGCLELYVRMIPWELKPGANVINGVSVQGIGFLSECDSNFRVATVTALGGQLYRRRGTNTDIELRAWDYVVEPEPDELIYYLPTPYFEVWTVQRRSERYLFSFDIYFADGVDNLFGLALVTAELKFQPCDSVAWQMGLAAGAGLINLLSGFSLSF